MNAAAAFGAEPQTGGYRAFPRIRLARLVLVGVAALILILLALSTPLDHDEDQYFAATVLAQDLTPYRDFAYLQTPLQPLVTAPIAAISTGYTLIVLRLVNALAALLTLGAVVASARIAGARERAALLAAAALLACYSFQFSASVFRNDAMPALLLAAAMMCGLAALSADRRQGPAALLWSLTGLELGLATSFKISYAATLAAVSLFALICSWRPRRSLIPIAIPFAGGAIAGLLPTILLFLATPQAAYFDIVGFAVDGPFRWYRDNGLSFLLSPWAKLALTSAFLTAGPAFVAAIRAFPDRSTRTRGDVGNPQRGFLLALLIGGMLAALLPTPTWPQYLVPLLPPLFVYDAIRQPRAEPRRAGRILQFLFHLFTALGLARGAIPLATTFWIGSPVLQATREAHWVGDVLRDNHLSGTVVETLAPHAIIDGGAKIDVRLSTGVFTFRTGDDMETDERRSLRLLAPEDIESTYAAAPPTAILVGYEQATNTTSVAADDALTRFATTHGYRLFKSSYARAQLYLRPTF